NERANRLANHLIDRGIGPENLVALAPSAPLNMTIALLGVSKAGAAYLPLDPSHPRDRLARLVSEAAPRITLVDRESLRRFEASESVVNMDDPSAVLSLSTAVTANPSNADRVRPLSGRNPAYLIYTSGTTSLPKAVVIEHQSVVRLLSVTDRWFHF